MRRSGSAGALLIVILAVIATIVMAVVTGITGGDGFLRRGISVALKPMQSVVSDVAKRVSADPASKEEVARLREEVSGLELELSQANEDIRSAQEALDENERLKNLLAFSAENPEYTYLDAKVISGSSAAWESKITIDKGSGDGLEKNMCVITDTGYLIGVVTGVAANRSEVTTILDAKCGVGAEIYGRRDTGVTSGDLNLLQEGLLKLEYLQENTSVKAGDTVLTSGKGGVYPAGLVIGTVDTVSDEKSGIGLYAVLEPRADIKELTQVFIITNYEYRD